MARLVRRRYGDARDDQVTELSWTDRDHLHRTAKLLLDTDQASTPAEATHQLERFRLQVVTDNSIAGDLAAQAALLTATNAGMRALLGGVHVQIADDPVLHLPWAHGLRLSDAVTRLGGHVVDVLDPTVPTFVIGDARPVRSDIVMHGAWHGWSGGVIQSPASHSTPAAMPLAGVVAGALAVAETFQHHLGSARAARRETGLSLWRPDLAWDHPDAIGPSLMFLPSGLWLLGLGHLGQANAWALGCLPYPADGPLVMLVDDDHVVEANLATGLLLTEHDAINRRPKTRVVASRLEQLGFRAAIVERRYDQHTQPSGREPTIALAGFDQPAPRRLLGGCFDLAIDVGLGAGPIDYLDIAIHRFPSALTPEQAFPARTRPPRPLGATYEAEIQRRTSAGVAEGDVRCGMVEIAGATVGAAFVGATAGALAVSDLLRELHGGTNYTVISVDLRSPHCCAAVPDSSAGPEIPGFLLADDTGEA